MPLITVSRPYGSYGDAVVALLQRSTIQMAVFVLFSLALIYLSRRSLRRPRSHGFCRFWAWEAIIALIVLNAPVWFRDPFSAHQIVSWLLLVASLIPLVLGLRLLGQAGHLKAPRPDEALFGFEQTAELVMHGIYRHIRHPMYSSLLLLAWGVAFKAPSWAGAALAAAATGCLLVAAKAEERENLGFFGPAYAAYMRGTKRFLPFLF